MTNLIWIAIHVRVDKTLALQAMEVYLLADAAGIQLIESNHFDWEWR